MFDLDFSKLTIIHASTFAYNWVFPVRDNANDKLLNTSTACKRRRVYQYTGHVLLTSPGTREAVTIIVYHAYVWPPPLETILYKRFAINRKIIHTFSLFYSHSFFRTPHRSRPCNRKYYTADSIL